MTKRALSGPRTLLICVLCMATAAMAQDDYARDMGPMRVDGRITDGENKLAGAEVVVYKGNEVAETVTTDKGGRFKVDVDMNESYAFEFRHTAFVAKRIALDTHMPKPKPGQEFELVPLDLTISLLEKARYDGAPTDDLDFPFAFIKFNKRTLTFEQDAEYTMGMQRTNGALLLMAARADKH